MSDDSSDFDDVQTEKTEKDRDQAGVDEKDNFMSSSEESDEEEKQEDEDQPKDESDQDSDIEGIVSNSGIEISRISHPAFTWPCMEQYLHYFQFSSKIKRNQTRDLIHQQKS